MKKPADRGAAIRAGITRHIAGENRVSARRAAKKTAKPAAVAKPATTALEATERKPLKISDNVISRARQMSHKLARKVQKQSIEDVFKPFAPAPGVLPTGAKPMAMDEALGGNFNQLQNWALGDGLGGSLLEEGIGFLGYAYLAQLTQRPEYRRISERIATEMTRKWIKFNVVSKIEDDPALIAQDLAGAEPAKPKTEGEGPAVAAQTATEQQQEDQDRVRQAVGKVESAKKAKRVKELEDELRRLKVKDAFYNTAEGDGWFGRYHLYLDIKGADIDTAEGKEELKVSIGNGRNATSKAKVKKGKLLALRCVEPMWCYPAVYDAMFPTKASFYTPSSWYVNGVQHHGSRLLTFVGREVPDILKPAYAFGGLSMSQMAKPYVDNWLRTRQAVADLIESFSVSGVYTNMQGALQDGGVEALKRIELFNIMRSNASAFALDKDTEEFFNVSTPLGTLDALQAQSQEQMSSVSGIPLIILLGITPTGLNASSEGEIRAFYDWIHAFQESFFRDHLQTVIHFVMLSLWGEIDEEITFEFEPLWSMTDKEQAEIQKIEAETDEIRINSGVLDPGEVRKALAAQPESRYADINVEDVPEPPEQPGGGEDPFGRDDGGEGGGGSEADNAFDGALDGAVMFLDRVPGESRAEFEARRVRWIEASTMAFDEWNESDHPRAEGGQFGSGGGGSSQARSRGGKKPSTKPSATPSSLDVSKLKKQGGRLGSNEGGVYTDDAGAKFYVKKPPSQAHVANEMAAARLYELAGVNTLKYRDAGPDHVVTEWQDLDKNNISKFSAAEKKTAASDFAVHAWLSNWDAAGLGGDNQGVMGGKPTTLDVGGSLRYRAQGGEKGKAFGNKVTELDTLRDKSMNPDAAELFSSMSDAEITQSVKRVTDIPDDKIRAAVGGDNELADRLIARKNDMAKRASGLANDETMMTAALDAAEEDDEELTGDAAIMAAALDTADDEPAEDAEPEEVAPDVFAMDEGQFDESKHKRDAGGQFSSTGSGGGAAKPDDGKSAELTKVFATKKEHIAHLLTHGVTPKALMQAMGWPSVSMPAQAKSLKMKLSVETIGGQKVYVGTPMTEAEIKAAKEEETGKKTDAEAQQILKNAGLNAGAGKVAAPKAAKPEPLSKEDATDLVVGVKDYAGFLDAMAEASKHQDKKTASMLVDMFPAWAETFSKALTPSAKQGLEALAGKPAPKLAPGPKKAAEPAVPKATAEELKKAKKSTPLPISSSNPEAAAAIKTFNDKYAGKDNLSTAQLNQKVADHKAVLATVKQKESEATEAAAAEQKKKEQAAAKKKANAAAKAQAELDAKFAADPELKLHHEAMVALFGGGAATAKYTAHAKAKVDAAGLDKVMRGEDAVPIIAYSGTHYGELNSQLRRGQMTKAQFAFMKSLNAGLEKMPAYAKPTYRKATLTPEQAALYQPGSIIEERGFTSTSKKETAWHGDHQFTVHGKNGRDISKLSSHPGESEVLFKSGARFEVVSRSGKNIVLKEV